MAIRVKVSASVRGYLEGGSLFQSPENADADGWGVAGQSLVRKVEAVRATAYVTLDQEEAAILRELVDMMWISAADDAGFDPGARGERNAANRLLFHLRQQGVE